MILFCKTLIFSTLLFWVNLYPNSGWHWVNPYPQGNELNDVFVIDEANAIAVGNCGTIIHIDNESQINNIQYYASGEKDNFRSVFFIDSNIGWMISRSGYYKSIVLKTTDGGYNWNVVYELYESIMDLQFVNRDTGYVLTFDGLLLSSTDGGDSWCTSNIENGSNSTSLHFRNDSTGYICTRMGKILKTNNKGATWSLIYNNNDLELGKIQFLSDSIGYVACEYRENYQTKSAILKTQNKGDTWEFIKIENVSDWINDMYFCDELHGWMVFLNDLILETIDGGMSWMSHRTHDSFRINSIHFNKNQSFGVAVGAGGEILIKNDNEESFQSCIKTISDDNSFRDLYFLDALNGWTISTNEILKTMDGGENWILKAKVWRLLEKIHFFSDSVGIALGSDAEIYYTENGGERWFQITSGIQTHSSFYDFCVVNVNTIYAVNGIRNVYKTENFGRTWEKIVEFPPDFAIDVFFVNPDTGWVVGADGLVMKSIDGGDTWEYQVAGYVNDFYSCAYFLNADTGWVAGNLYSIYKTNNGGRTWDRQFVIYNAELWPKDYPLINSFFFVDNNIGWAATESGDILYTETSGQEWNLQKTNNSNSLWSIFFADQYHGWAVGWDGTILRTCSSGKTDARNIFIYMSATQIQVTENDTLFYYPEVSCVDLDAITFSFIDYPHWLSSYDDCISGHVPEGAQDTTFKVIINQYSYSDTITVYIQVDEDYSNTNKNTNKNKVMSYKLYQNYPNPFNNCTRIEFDVEKSSRVNLAIFNILGQKIKTLINEDLSVGKHYVLVSSNELGSGIYIYKIKMGNYTDYKKMLVIQ